MVRSLAITFSRSLLAAAIFAASFSVMMSATLVVTSAPAGASATSPCTWTGTGTQVFGNAGANQKNVYYTTGAVAGTTTVAANCSYAIPSQGAQIVLLVNPLGQIITPLADVPSESDLSKSFFKVFVNAGTSQSPVNVSLPSTFVNGGTLSYNTGTFSIWAYIVANSDNNTTDGTCPPSQTDVDAGLGACGIIAVSSNGTDLVIESETIVTYAGQPTPSTPTATFNTAVAQPGGSVTVTGGTNWWGSHRGAPYTALATDFFPGNIPAPSVYLGTSQASAHSAGALASSGITISLPAYACANTSSVSGKTPAFGSGQAAIPGQGTLPHPNPCNGAALGSPTKPALNSTGTFTIPGGTTPGLYNIYIDETNLLPINGNGPNNSYQLLQNPSCVLNALPSAGCWGTAESTTAISVQALPTVTDVDPATGPVEGGTPITVTGTNFYGTTSVKVGANSCTSLSVVSNTSITCTTPAGSAGAKDVTVTNAIGTSATSANDQFSYGGVPVVPTVTQVNPNAGSTAGGTLVTISGTEFVEGATVSFGANAATAVSVNGSTSISATSPAGSIGTVDVTVTTVGGTSATSASDQFTYGAPPSTPAVTGVSPTSGPTGGGTIVSITGTNFTGASTVKFGENFATGVVFNDSTSLTATSPAGTAGITDVRVTTIGGTSAISASDKFTYLGAPTVSSVAPNAGSPTGGTNVLISGTNFVAGATVKFGANSASSVVVQNSTSITATSPAGAINTTVDVKVTTPGGTSAANASDRFAYGAPSVTGVSPNSGPAAGGTSVSISGSNFVSGASVNFGPNAATSVVVNSPTSITATSPASTPDLTIDVTVSNAAGTSAATEFDQFTYGSAPPPPPEVPPGGYWLLASDGGIFAFGDAAFYGSTGAITLNKPIVGMAPTPSGQGYWMVASDGGIFAFGDAAFYGSTGAITLSKPIVAMATTPGGLGYWLLASDGGIFAFGDAGFYGSAGGVPRPNPIVAMVATPTGLGYTLVDSAGGVWVYGDAIFHGSTGGEPLARPIVGLASTADGGGYWMVASDGGIFAYGNAGFFGSTGAISLNQPIVGITPTQDGQGYWMVAADGGIFAFGNAAFFGSTGAMVLNKPIVTMASPA